MDEMFRLTVNGRKLAAGPVRPLLTAVTITLVSPSYKMQNTQLYSTACVHEITEQCLIQVSSFSTCK